MAARGLEFALVWLSVQNAATSVCLGLCWVWRSTTRPSLGSGHFGHFANVPLLSLPWIKKEHTSMMQDLNLEKKNTRKRRDPLRKAEGNKMAATNHPTPLKLSISSPINIQPLLDDSSLGFIPGAS
ncbi:hypothetical protein E2320_011057, partial [Naja naja]